MEEKVKEQVKYQNLSDNICVALSFFVFAIIFELVSSLLLFGFFPTYFYISLMIISLWAFIIFLLPTKTFRKIVACVLLVFQFIILLVNDVLYNITGEVFTFDKLFLANEAAGTFSVMMINFWHMLLYALVLAAALFCVFGLPKYIKIFKATKKQFTALVASSLFVMFSFLGCASVEYLQNRNLILTEYPTTLAYSTLGFYGFYCSNAMLSIGALNSSSELSKSQYEEYLAYLSAGSTPSVTEMSGVSEGNNVLLILAESFDVAAIDEYFTPNLYKMWFEDGMFLQNYYAENKTNMSEGMALFGTYGRERPLITNVKLAEVYDYFSLPSLLKDKDESIQTLYTHSFKSSFYKRDITHSKVGFDNTIFASEQQEDIKKYNIENDDDYTWSVKDIYNNYMKDSNFFEYNKEQIIPSTGRFFTSFSTMVTHGTYEDRGSNREYYNILTSEENKEHFDKMIEDMNAQGFYIDKIEEKFLYYKAAVMDFDKMIGMMFDRLNELSILDKTTIYMFPDHNAYYDDLSYVIRGIDKSQVRLCNVNAYNIGACIYDQKVIKKYKGEEEYTSGVVVDKFTSVNDVYPTLCDILNLNYNTNLCYGKSLFLDEDRVFISLKDDRYILNDKYYYYDNKVYDAKTRKVCDNEEVQIQVDNILLKFEIHEKLYKSKKSFVSILEELGYEAKNV